MYIYFFYDKIKLKFINLIDNILLLKTPRDMIYNALYKYAHIEITPEEYHRNNSNVRVRDGRLVAVTWATTTKLVPGNSGSPCHPDNVAVIVASDQPHTRWSKRTYETN